MSAREQLHTLAWSIGKLAARTPALWCVVERGNAAVAAIGKRRPNIRNILGLLLWYMVGRLPQQYLRVVQPGLQLGVHFGPSL